MATPLKTNKLAALLVGSAMALSMASAQAALSSVGPFAGDLSETWEGFPNYQVPVSVTYLANPTDIMGGAASIASGLMAVYEPGSGASFGLSSSGTAQVADGAKAMGLDDANQTAVITFDNDQTQFGAFWGAATSDQGATIRVVFLDANNAPIDFASFVYDHRANADGGLDWHGWSSTVAFRSVAYTGDFVVNDGLQASGPNNNNRVPEPGSLALAGVALLSLAAALKRKHRQ